MFEVRQTIVNRSRGLRLTAGRRFSHLIAATLFPPRCCLCGFEGSPPDLDLCGFCRADLPWDPDCAPGRVNALLYEPPADELIRRLKYANEFANARVLAELLAQAVRACGGALPRLLVPVPLHPARYRERGFNQAEMLARYAGRSLQIWPAPNLLRRLRDTPSQTELGMDQRQRNVRGAFAIPNAIALRKLREAEHVAIIDDVTTTGSTLAEARGVILAAGVRQVDVWAVARAP
jgi:ComF family protein